MNYNLFERLIIHTRRNEEGIPVAEIKYEIIETIAVLSESPKGWKKELNLISWNGLYPKYDLREWAPGHEKMGKGITLSKEELTELKRILNEQNDL